MRFAAGTDLAKLAGSCQARKRPVEVEVQFATANGRLETLEGPVSYRAGDALLTGSAGERWPVSREKFLKTYESAEPEQAQCRRYRKRAIVVRVLQVEEPFEVAVGRRHELLTGRPGDWLIQYGPGEFGIVASDIFDHTYERLDEAS